MIFFDDRQTYCATVHMPVLIDCVELRTRGVDGITNWEIVRQVSLPASACWGSEHFTKISVQRRCTISAVESEKKLTRVLCEADK